MTSRRLSKNLIQEIADTGCNKKYNAKIESATQALANAALAVYEARLMHHHSLTRTQLEALAKKAEKAYLALPDVTRNHSNPTRKTQELRISAPGLSDYGASVFLPTVVYDFSGRAAPCMTLNEHPTTLAAAHAFEVVQKLKEEKTKAHAELSTALAKFTTTKKLLAEWPEIEELIPRAANPTNNLPAIPVHQLNEKFGLPSPTAQAS
ncbi:hypothetical protein DV711_06270 [Motiliproteus coralliicola]|uniref:Nucleotide modification associated domain-containing protein n=1 Tax=Motiliproteus coralliicola TaxID=2283196 RepID=A0A369WST6_9GAMM|nr:Nmad5 family putative nucleotide modification protein [Motiliproteus coralliicola]RDE25158.1 hypothetical protein DV711_06270 [Motiliproteus coralliicola]